MKLRLRVPLDMIRVGKFGQAIYRSMIFLGRLFRLIDFDISHLVTEKPLPKLYFKENLKATQLG